MPDGEERVDQLAARSRDMAGSIETHASEIAELVARVGSIEARLQATQTAQGKSADRLERLAVDLDLGPALAALADQVAALREAQSANAVRIEAVVSQLGEMSRLDAAIAHLRGEMLSKAESADRSLRADLTTATRQAASDIASMARDIHVLRERTDELALLGGAIDSLARNQTEAFGAQQRLAAQFAENAGVRGEFAEMLRRSEHHVSSRLDGAAEKVEELEAEISQWRSRIEQQSELVREARGVADAMRAEATRIAEAQHAIAEAERLFEDRLLSHIAAIRHEVEHTWEQFRQARAKQWSALADANAERDRGATHVENLVAETGKRLDGLERALTELAREQSEALHLLRRDVAGAMAPWREAVTTGVDLLEAALPPEEQSSETTARREALRRSLRAAREHPDH